MIIHNHTAKTLIKSKIARSSMNQRVEIRTEKERKTLSLTSKVKISMISMNNHSQQMEQIPWDLQPPLILTM